MDLLRIQFQKKGTFSYFLFMSSVQRIAEGTVKNISNVSIFRGHLRNL